MPVERVNEPVADLQGAARADYVMHRMTLRVLYRGGLYDTVDLRQEAVGVKPQLRRSFQLGVFILSGELFLG